jgi:ABC-2 type transport system permease protein
MILHIIYYKLITFFKTTFETRPVTIIRGCASLLVFGGFAFAAYRFSYATTYFVLEQTRTGLYLYHTFISMMLFVFFLAVNLGNIIVSYSTLYRSAEVSFLLTKPVPYTSIFVLKFFDNFFYSSTTLFIVAFMVLYGYGTYFEFPWYYFAGVMILILIPFMFLAACLAVLILMAIMKFAGTIGFRKVLAGLFLLYFFFIFLFFNSANPITIVEKVNRFYPNVDAYLSQAIPGFLPYLPNQWVANSLYFLARGEIIKALTYTGYLLLLAIIAFCTCLLVARKFYFKSWLVSLHIQSTAQVPYDPAKRILFDFRAKSILPAQLEVLVKKEFFAFIREASQWIHLVVMMILTVLFAISISHLNLRLRVLDVQLLTYLVIYSFGGFMVSSLALRFVFPSIGLEGKTFWALRSSPIKSEKIFWVKFLIGFFLVFFLAEYIAISSSIPFVRLTAMRPLLLWFGIFSAFWISLAIVSMNLGLGGFFANYLERNPIRAASTQGATLSFLLTLVYLIIIVVVIIVPVSSYFAALFQFRLFKMETIILPGTLFAVLSYIFAVFGWIVGIRSLRRDF